MALKNVLVENLRVKLLVGILAMLFWFAVVTENFYEYDVEVPIVAVNVPDGKIVANDLPAKARVRFEGKGRALLNLLFSREARVVLDLANVRQSHTFILQRQMVQSRRSSAELNPVHVLYPDTVRVKLTRLLEKRVPVTANMKITTMAGYTVVQPFHFEPDSITISGPAEIIHSIDSVTTEYKEFSNLQHNLTERFRLQPLPASQHVAFSDNTVQVDVDVEKLIEMTLQEIPVQVHNAPAHLKITPAPSTLSLTVEGAEKLLLNLKKENIVAYIDYARMRDTTGAGHPAYIRTPDGVRYRDVKPARFKLILESQNHAAARH